jgi:hypothetical protein
MLNKQVSHNKAGRFSKMLLWPTPNTSDENIVGGLLTCNRLAQNSNLRYLHGVGA